MGVEEVRGVEGVAAVGPCGGGLVGREGGL